MKISILFSVIISVIHISTSSAYKSFHFSTSMLAFDILYNSHFKWYEMIVVFVFISLMFSVSAIRMFCFPIWDLCILWTLILFHTDSLQIFFSILWYAHFFSCIICKLFLFNAIIFFLVFHLDFCIHLICVTFLAEHIIVHSALVNWVFLYF